MTHANFISCIDGNKAVHFIPNGGNMKQIFVFALQDGEFWYKVGTYKSVKTAKAYAVKSLAQMGYHFDETEMKNLVIE